MRNALLPLLAAIGLSPCLAQVPPAASSIQPPGTPAASSPSGAVLTLQRAIDMALAGHPLLAAGRSDIEAADAALSQAGARPNPVLQAELEDTRRETRSTTVLLTQPIELGGKRAARLDVAERSGDLARSQYASARSLLRAQVTSAFVDALTAQERLRAADASLELAQRATDAASKRVIAGKVSPIEETKAKVAEANVRVERVQASGELRAALLALQSMVGTSTGPISRVEGSVSLPLVPADIALQSRLAASPAVRQAQLEVDRFGSLAKLERTRRVPDLTVGIGTKRSEELGRNQTLLAVSIPLPVFDTNRGAELEAMRRHDKARYDAEAAALRLRAEAVRAQERLRTAVAEAQALQDEVLPGAQTAYEAASKGFELGKFSFLDVLDSQRTLLEARSRHLRAVAEAHRSAAEIDRLLGDGLDAAAPAASQPKATP